MTLAKRWASEDATITDVKSAAPEEGGYEPFSDPDVEFDVTKWPTKKPVPTTVTTWDDKKSAPAGTVQGNTKAPAKGTQ